MARTVNEILALEIGLLWIENATLKAQLEAQREIAAAVKAQKQEVAPSDQ
jgi:hypothetical protein